MFSLFSAEKAGGGLYSGVVLSFTGQRFSGSFCAAVSAKTFCEIRAENKTPVADKTLA